MRCSSSFLGCVVTGLALFLAAQLSLNFAQPPSKEKEWTAEQKQKLKERQRYSAESSALEQQGKLPEAIATTEKMLAIERSLFGDVHEDVVGSLKRLARMHETLEDFAAAEKERREVLALQSKLLGSNHWKVADARLEMQYVQDLAKLDRPARQQLKQAQEWIALAETKIRSASSEQGISVAGKVMAIRAHLSGEFSQLATSSAIGAGQAGELRDLLQRALAIQKKVLPPTRSASEGPLTDHFQTAAPLNSLGLLLYRQGDYAAARPCFEQALALRKKMLGNDHPDTATCLNNLGALLDCQGDYQAARPYYEQALATQKKLLGEDHQAIFLTLNNLGSLHANQKNYAEARQYFEKALAIARKHPTSQASTALALNNLGTLLAAQGDHDAAHKNFKQAFEISQEAFGENDPDTAFALNNLGVLLYLQGKYAEARPFFERTLAIRKNLVGDQHPDTSASLNNLGTLLCRQGDFDAARTCLEQAMKISRRSLDLSAAAQSERQQLLMGMRLRHQFDNFLNLPCDTEKDTAAAYGHVLAWKGSVLIRQQQFHLERQDPTLAPLVARLRDKVSELANMAFVTPGPGNHAEWSRHLAELTREQEALERELAGKSARFRFNQELHRLTPAELRERIPADMVLCDYVVYRRGQPNLAKKGPWLSVNHLAVFVVKKGQPVVRIDLGPLEPIEKAIDLWHARTKERFVADADHPGMELRRRLWLPLQKHLAGAKTVVISPDGALGRLPFAALPGSKEGSYLLEDVAITVVPVPQLLPELFAGENSAKKEPSLLLVGDVDFDAGAGSASNNRTAATAKQHGERGKWEPLKGTKGEILWIRDAFDQRFNDGKLKVLRGGLATEATIRELASKYSHLHFATHGFFSPPTVRSALALGSEESKRGADDLFGEQGVAGFHPGLMSGLVFAGANRPHELGQSDGILTALEVAELDLSKVDLAVLSACQTGLGKEAAGEGILGLQRAFQVAGAKSVVASLWIVDDDATRKLMERFYENLWQKNLPKQEALRQAQLAMLRGDLGRGFIPDELKMSPRLPPHYWAAFVLSGDWR